MEGFLSTSLSRSKAIDFMVNALIKINVDPDIDEENEEDLEDFGFASFVESKINEKEKEILFNAINMFKVVEVKEN